MPAPARLARALLLAALPALAHGHASDYLHAHHCGTDLAVGVTIMGNQCDGSDRSFLVVCASDGAHLAPDADGVVSYHPSDVLEVRLGATQHPGQDEVAWMASADVFGAGGGCGGTHGAGAALALSLAGLAAGTEVEITAAHTGAEHEPVHVTAAQTLAATASAPACAAAAATDDDDVSEALESSYTYHRVTLSWTVAGGYLVAELVLDDPDPKWVSVGVTTTTSMVAGDDAEFVNTVLVYEPGAPGAPGLYELTAKSSSGVSELSGHAAAVVAHSVAHEVLVAESTAAGGTVLRFRRPYDGGGVVPDVVPETVGTLMWAYGRDDTLGMHEAAGAAAINWGTGHATGTATGVGVSTAIVVHSVLMMVAWAVLMLPATLLARVLRSDRAAAWLASGPKDRWFKVHRGLASAGAVLAAAGAVVAVAGGDIADHFSSRHGLFGLVVLLLLPVQVALAVAHVHPWHRFLGAAIAVGATVVTFLGASHERVAGTWVGVGALGGVAAALMAVLVAAYVVLSWALPNAMDLLARRRRRGLQDEGVQLAAAGDAAGDEETVAMAAAPEVAF